MGNSFDLISTIGFGEKYDESDLLGEVYEYFLGQFASAEGKKGGGQFYTPSHEVKTLVAVLSEPTSGMKIYDPTADLAACLSKVNALLKRDNAQMTSQSMDKRAIQLHGDWQAMNLAIRGFAADLGKEPADT